MIDGYKYKCIFHAPKMNYLDVTDKTDVFTKRL